MQQMKSPMGSLLTLVLCLLVLAAGVPIDHSQSGKIVGVLLNQNTEWKLSDSPIIFNAPVVISKGVTLSIDPGTTVNLNNYYLQVDGTLRAVGTETNQIHINGPQQSTSAKINFTNTSPSWRQQDSSGSIISYCVINATSIDVNGTSPKISNNFLSAYSEGSVVFSINASPTITNNNIITAYSAEGIAILGGSPTISNNLIHSAIVYEGSWGIGITGNDNSALIYGNTISGFQAGILFGEGSPTVERNNITGNIQAINLDTRSPQVLKFQNNTVTHNRLAIIIGVLDNSSVISFNNFEDNDQLAKMSDYLPDNTVTTINAQNNWWGTEDSAVVNQTINTGLYTSGAISGPFFVAAYVQVIPVLSSLNPNALPEENNYPASIEVGTAFPTASSPQPTAPTTPTTFPTSQTASPAQPSASSYSPSQIGIDDFQLIVLIGIFVIIALLVALFLLLLRRKERVS